MTDLKYWIWLSLAAKQSSRKMTSLLERFESPLEIYRAKESDFRGIALNRAEMKRLCDKNLQGAEAILEQCRKQSVRVMTLDSPYYPRLLANIFDPPYVLYVKCRERVDLNRELAIAMVGTRDMTAYGRAVAMEIAGGLARAGVTVVSGMARGIDGAAMTAALNHGGKVIAVLGNGLDIVYPPEHEELMERIAHNGMVLSEYPFGTAPYPANFPVRNRIISGISSGTVVIESPEAGGSLITANQALEQGRDVFAVPGDINRAYSEGTNELIRQGAHLVSSALDILTEYREEYIHIFEKAVNNEQDIKIKQESVRQTHISPSETAAMPSAAPPANDNAKYRALPPEEKEIVDALSLIPMHVDVLTEKTKLDVSKLNAALTMLEMKGLIKQLAGRHYVLNL